MTPNNMPLNAYPVLRAKNIDEVEEKIAHLFGNARILDLPDGIGGLDAKGNLCQLSKIGIWCCAYGVPIKIKFIDTAFIRLQYCRSGSATSSIDKRRFPVTKRESCVLPAVGVPVVSEYAPDYQQMMLRIELKHLSQKLVALTGIPISRALEFEPAVDLAAPASQYLRRMTELLAHNLDSIEGEYPPLALAELEQALMVVFLCANRHNYSDLLERQPSAGAPWQVRCVEEYIETNWNRPISVIDIAAATGASARSIFRTFRQSRGYSPMAFAKQVRLRHAQRMLKSADATMTVTDVAFACGFGDLGRFSKDYRQAFGELPSQVLNRTKGAGSLDH